MEIRYLFYYYDPYLISCSGTTGRNETPTGKSVLFKIVF
jgi:hypothetical protein